MKIKAIWKEKIVYIIGFTAQFDKVVAVITRPFLEGKPTMEVVPYYELHIRDDKYDPYGEELQE